MKKQRKQIDIFNLSFLDVISCGFGAIILLLVLSEVSEPLVRENEQTDLLQESVQLQEEIEQRRVEIDEKDKSLQQQKEQILALQTQTLQLEKKLAAVEKERSEVMTGDRATSKIEQQLLAARQQLNEEIRRLQKIPVRKAMDSPIGGVPVDSEYIIFIIDTSGSMQRYAWRAVRAKMAEILAVYPRVKGIQVMNDMGDYMFSQYSGRWIPDSNARRSAILKRLASWSPFSNSSPVEGITSAIRRFYARDKKISLYVFGDDFSRGSIQEVVDTVDSINKGRASSERRVRIHAIGFPVLFQEQSAGMSVARFAALMRRLAEDNLGSFVGLTKM